MFAGSAMLPSSLTLAPPSVAFSALAVRRPSSSASRPRPERNSRPPGKTSRAICSSSSTSANFQCPAGRRRRRCGGGSRSAAAARGRPAREVDQRRCHLAADAQSRPAALDLQRRADRALGDLQLEIVDADRLPRTAHAGAGAKRRHALAACRRAELPPSGRRGRELDVDATGRAQVCNAAAQRDLRRAAATGRDVDRWQRGRRRGAGHACRDAVRAQRRQRCTDPPREFTDFGPLEQEVEAAALPLISHRQPRVCPRPRRAPSGPCARACRPRHRCRQTLARPACP